ncbi:hypothetical protein MHYP_G00283590 [Metynnis hypsauchen]
MLRCASSPLGFHQQKASEQSCPGMGPPQGSRYSQPGSYTSYAALQPYLEASAAHLTGSDVHRIMWEWGRENDCEKRRLTGI